MATSRNLMHRLAHLEGQAIDRAAEAEAQRLSQMVSAPPDLLLARAQAIAELIAIHGYHRALELIGVGVGVSPEQLEASAARLAPDAI